MKNESSKDQCSDLTQEFKIQIPCRLAERAETYAVANNTFNCRQWYKPKSKASYREIDLGPQMMMALKRWKLECPKNDLELVFPADDGKPIEPTYLVRNHFYPALSAAGLKKIRFHDLRHTYASILIKQGENIKYIRNQLGHSTPTVTLNIYAHLFESVNQEAACRLENTIFKKW